MENQRLNQRLASCRQVLRAINDTLRQRQYNHKILRQLHQLEQLMVALDSRTLTENDMQRIENSTNHLFGELTRLFTQPGVDKLYRREDLH